MAHVDAELISDEMMKPLEQELKARRLDSIRESILSSRPTIFDGALKERNSSRFQSHSRRHASTQRITVKARSRLVRSRSNSNKPITRKARPRNHITSLLV